MTRFSRVLSTALLTLVLAVAVAAPSSEAVTKKAPATISASVKSSNGGGAYASMGVRFTSKGEVWIDDLYLNDRCNAKGKGDGLVAYIRWEGQRGPKEISEVIGLRSDDGGCTSAPHRADRMRWSGVGPIYWVRAKVCVGKRVDRWEIKQVKCSYTSIVTNPKAGPVPKR